LFHIYLSNRATIIATNNYPLLRIVTETPGPAVDAVALALILGIPAAAGDVVSGGGVDCVAGK
jgi:hypothetical protein